MDIVLLRIGALDDWVRTAAAALETDPILCSSERAQLDPVLDGLGARRLVLTCGVPGLNAVVLRLVRRQEVERVPIGWIADPDRAARDLNRRLGLPARPTEAARLARSGTPTPLPLVRDDHGGVLLHRGRLGTVGGAATFGAQSYHDDALVAHGRVRSIDVRPTHRQPPQVVVDVIRSPVLRRRTTSTGRSIQTASDEAQSTVDGVAHPRPVTRWTWYADPRQYWLLRTAANCATPPDDPDPPAPH